MITTLKNAAETTSTPPPPRWTILVVDDDPMFLEIVEQSLRDPTWVQLQSDSAADALRVVSEHDGPIDLLLTDVVMPDVDGVALAARVREKYPAIRTLFMSGYRVDILARYGVPDGAELFIGKPFTGAALRDRVRKTLEKA